MNETHTSQLFSTYDGETVVRGEGEGEEEGRSGGGGGKGGDEEERMKEQEEVDYREKFYLLLESVGSLLEVEFCYNGRNEWNEANENNVLHGIEKKDEMQKMI